MRQFRPAFGGPVLEFPAGLVDAGESHEEAALRELREETGYRGQLKKLIAPKAVSSGLSSESIAMAMVDVDEEAEENLNPSPQLEDSEDLVTVLLHPEQWPQVLSGEEDADAKLCAYLLGKIENIG